MSVVFVQLFCILYLFFCVYVILAEMTLLGFIGLVFFFVNKSSVLNNLSEKVFHEEEQLNELFETVHMILFLVMMIFLLQIIIQLKYASVLETDWQNFENRAAHLRTEGSSSANLATDERFERYLAFRTGFVTPPEAFLARRSRADTKTSEKQETESNAEPAHKAHSKPANSITEEFDFATYLSLMLSHDLVELVEIPVKSWVLLWALFAVYWALDLVIEGNTFYLLVCVYVGCALLSLLVYFIKLKSRKIMDHLVVPVFNEPTLANNVQSGEGAKDNLVISVGDSSAIPSAKYRDLTLSEHENKHDISHLMHHHYKLADALPLRKQLSLYWFNEPEFMLSALQACTLVVAVLWSIVGVILLQPDLDMSTKERIGMAVLGFFLLMSCYIHIPEMLETFTLSLHLEQLKDAPAINKVNRQTRAKKTLGVLRMLGWMKTKHVKEGMADKEANTKTAQEVWPDPMICARKRQECKEMFKLFDDDDSGFITMEEFSQLLRDVANIDDEEEIQACMASLDTGGAEGEEGDGQVDFQEFFDWFARRQELSNTDNNTLINLIFQVVDKDNSGSITMEELQEAFQSLGEDVSTSDIQWLISECDDDGDNNISRDEFANLLQAYVFDA